MQYAFVDEKRQKAFKGGRGICPKCQEVVIASCGEIYIWHWKHQNICDSWFEPETEWHLDWKEQFPEDWQEFVIEDNATGIKHVADIKTNEGVVIEFQNSPISSAEIKEREEFYKNMIWVVNAVNFKDNFSFRSVVRDQLRVLEQNISNQKKAIKEQLEEDLNKAKENFKSLELEYLSAKNYITRLEDQFSEYVEYLSQSQCFSETIVTQLKKAHSIKDIEFLSQAYVIVEMVVTQLGKTIIDQKTRINYLTPRKSIHGISYKIHGLLEEIQKNVGEKFVIINQSIQSLKMNWSNLETRKNYLINLPDSDYLKSYKIIAFNQVEKVNLVNVKAVKVSSKFTLFPVVYDMNEEILSDFLIYPGYKDYEFLLNIQAEIEYIRQTRNMIENEIRIQSLQYTILYDQVHELIEVWITDKIYAIDNEYNECICELNKKEQGVEQEKRKLEKLEAEIQKKLEQSLANLEINLKNEDISIKKKYKGLYFYTWKYERKTWQYAKKTVYFDFGDGVLFKRVRSDLFRKILKQDFLDKYRL
ncbi:MAG: competence protein CoiA [Microcystaceae cyanobacterium]